MKVVRFFLGIVHKAIIFGILYLVLSVFLIEPVLLEKTDMSPSYLQGDVVFIRKYAYGYNKNSFPFSLPLLPTRIFEGKPKTGDTIAYVTTDAMRAKGEGRIAVKRVLAGPGDKVHIRDGILYINDKKNYTTRNGAVKLFEDGTVTNGKNIQGDIYDRFIEETYNGFKHYVIRKGMLPPAYSYMEPLKVPQEYYFVVGDKRDTAIDSRDSEYGLVSMDSIMGQVRVVFFKINLPLNELHDYSKWLKNYQAERFLLKVKYPE